jgi:hypothetical protein
VTFPLPKQSDLDAYVVYVGFDPNAMQTPAAKPKRPAKKTQ